MVISVDIVQDIAQEKHDVVTISCDIKTIGCIYVLREQDDSHRKYNRLNREQYPNQSRVELLGIASILDKRRVSYRLCTITYLSGVPDRDYRIESKITSPNYSKHSARTV